VLPRREVALLDGALLGIAALALEEQLHPLAAAQAADRSNVSSHQFSICDSRFVIRDFKSQVIANRRTITNR
jgi:hypothetical protein